MSNTLEIIISARDSFSRTLGDAASHLDGFASKAQRVGQSLIGVGGMLALAFAPMIAGVTEVTRTALLFDTAMTNIRSLTGATADEFVGMKDAILELGSESIAGPQAVSEAMYDIVSGVTDATTHMAILESAIATSEAGAADLRGTTAALVSVMNAYRFSANRAAYVSDVLTRTVGVGVGTMEEFAAAIPTVTGVAAQVGAEFDDVGSQLAYLTTQGYTASVAATQLRQSFVALLNPNEAMREALEQIGYESGSASLEALGLVGTYQALSAITGGSVDAMAKATGSVEALQAVLALTSEGFATFNEAFDAGVEGATDAAQGIQRSGVEAELKLLNSQIDTLKIRVGDALVPALLDVVAGLTPVIDSVTTWVAENPALVAQLAQIAIVGFGVGAALVVVGTVISSVATLVGLLNGAIGLLTSTAFLPLAGIIALVGGLFYAYQNNILGFRDRIEELGVTLRNAGKTIEQLGFIMKTLVTNSGVVSNAVASEFDAMSDSIADSLNRASDDISNWLNETAASLGIGSTGMQ
ncbi:MAG: phage tail tape measure protein, partial [Chloroflexota bacterium]|nr:phage tail tape measure protein [Chloroflexota bacterium]